MKPFEISLGPKSLLKGLLKRLKINLKENRVCELRVDHARFRRLFVGVRV